LSGFEVSFYLIILLVIAQFGVFGLFAYLYMKKKQASFLSIIISVIFFIISNILSLYFINRPQDWKFDFFQGLLAAAGLAPIVVFLEIFENGYSFTQRSSLSIVFLIVIGAINGAAKAIFPLRVGKFINLIAPIMYIAVGSFYLNTIKKIRERIRFENQKKKIRVIRLGIYLTFIIPKFVIGAILGLTVLPILLALVIPSSTFLQNYDVSFLETPEMNHIIEFTLNVFQTIGLVVISLPIIYSKSVFFMQSRKVSKLIVINADGTPIYSFDFESKKGNKIKDETFLLEAYAAVSTLVQRGGITKQRLRSILFEDLEIMTELRENFAALLVCDKPTKFLSEALEDFADNFETIYPKTTSLSEIKIQKIKYNAEKMVQKSFGLATEEFDQIKTIIQEGYDKVAKEYLASRSENDPEVKLLPDFMKRLPVGARVLDAGCGAGEPVTRILSEKFKVTGVDISKKQIEIARENLPFCDFIWQDMTSLTFPDEYFDGIISYYAIPNVPREEHKGLLENFYRMLKPNGLALLSFGTSDEPGIVVDDFFGVKMYWSSFDAGTNIDMLKEVGFHVVWLKFIFDDITDEQHIFVLAQKLEPDFMNELETIEPNVAEEM